MTRRGFMGRLAVAMGATAMLPGVRMPVGDAIVAGKLKEATSPEFYQMQYMNEHVLDIGANQVARMEDSFVTITDMHPVKWDNIITFDFMKKCDEGGALETDAAYVKRYKKFLEDMEYQKLVTGNAVARITGRKA